SYVPPRFLFTHTAPPHIYPLSLHDALPISCASWSAGRCPGRLACRPSRSAHRPSRRPSPRPCSPARRADRTWPETSGLAGSPARSEEHTSELQSLTNLVCRLLLEKNKSHKC